MIVAVHQPQYLPWPGYFHKMMVADVFCYLDNVQFKKNEWQNRNRLKTSQGWQWMTVPVRYRHPQKIADVEINDTVNWGRKHLRALDSNYRRAPWFGEYMPLFESIFARRWKRLAELNIFVIERLREVFHLDNKRALPASSLDVSDDPTGRLIDICKHLGADTYLSGADGARYMDLARFEQNNISVVFQRFQHPVYPQLFGEFQPHLSIVDLLFNCGPESVNVIQTANP